MERRPGREGRIRRVIITTKKEMSIRMPFTFDEKAREFLQFIESMLGFIGM